MVAGKFVGLNELLSSNIVLNEPEPQLLFNGPLSVEVHPQESQTLYRGYHDLDGGFFYLLPCTDLPSSATVKRLKSIKVADISQISAIHQPSLADL